MSSQENRMAQANITQYPLEIMDSCTPDDINAFLDSQKQKDDVAPELLVVLIKKLMRDPDSEMADKDLEALDMLCDRLQLVLASVKAAPTLHITKCPDAIDARISAPSDAMNEAISFQCWCPSAG